MDEETEQLKKQKKEKQSSTDMIDSFFGSHKFDNEQSNQQNQRDFHETEELIDKLLDNKSSSIEQDETLSPSVNVVEKTHEQTFKEHNKITNNHDDLQGWNPVVESHEKEEIFELDIPESPKPFQESKEKSSEKNQEKKTLTFLKQKKPQPQKSKSSEKKSFSFHLPKLNINLKKSTKEPKRESYQKEQSVEFKELEYHQKTPLEIKKDTESETRIDQEIIQTGENNDYLPEKKPVKNKKQKEKQKTTFFKTNDKSHSIFKKKANDKQTKIETEKQKLPNQIQSEPAQPVNEESISSEQVTTNSGTVDKDLIQLLKITDDLLGKLPDEVIEEFSQSEDFTLYEKVMKKYDILK
jgi:hypothetical protein